MIDGPARYDVGIVGLGYVGLILATVLAEAGMTVVGVESRREVVELTNQGIPHFTETGLPDALAGVTKSGKLVAAERFDDSLLLRHVHRHGRHTAHGRGYYPRRHDRSGGPRHCREHA